MSRQKTSQIMSHSLNRTLLKDSFPNVEILTYDEIIKKAKNALKFWEEYEKFEEEGVGEESLDESP